MLAKAQWVFGALWRRLRWAFAGFWHRRTLGGVGPGTRFHQRVRIRVPERVCFGAACLIWEDVVISSEGQAGGLRAGDRVAINAGALLDVSGGLVLGDDVVISAEALLYTHDHGHDPQAPPQFLPKHIAPRVWIGARAIILPGCRHIGVGAVIGAGAVVGRDVPAGAVMAGNPARQIGQRQANDRVPRRRRRPQIREVS